MYGSRAEIAAFAVASGLSYFFGFCVENNFAGERFFLGLLLGPRPLEDADARPQ